MTSATQDLRLPSQPQAPPCQRYQFMLFGDRSMCVRTTCSRLLTESSGLEPAISSHLNVNSALRPFVVAKSSTSLAGVKAGKSPLPGGS